MSRWFRDTLFLRLFVLMWVALVGSHVAAFGIVFGWRLPPDRAPDGFSWRDLPTLPSLPPTPGLPGPGRSRPSQPLASGIGHEPGPAHGFGHPPRLPTPLLVLDYLVRLVVIAAAAALGARWLAVPVRRLIDASNTLGATLGSAAPLPVMDDRSGTVEVREAARVFNRMASELDAQFRSRGLLMASLSHDLKTPLTRMRMRLENEPDSAAAQRSIADIGEMTRLLDEALDVFRHAAESDEPMQRLDVHALLQSIADDLEAQGSRVEVSGAAAVVLAMPLDLRRVFDNLLANAVRYGHDVCAAVAVEAATVRVVIDDQGPGIPDAMLEAVFQPFFRVESSRNRASGGSGMGLYIARDLLRRQGGRIELANRAGGGLRVTVTLPAAAA